MSKNNPQARTVETCREHFRHGLIPAVPVPFTAAGVIDQAAQKQYISKMNEQPIAGIAVWAHTGRGLLMSREQRNLVLGAWSEGLGDDKLVVTGVGGNPKGASNYSSFLASALEMARDAQAGGAHVFLVHPPTVLRDLPGASSDEKEDHIFEYHKELAATGTPLILFYLYEAAGGVSYSPALLRRLFALPEVIGIKLATLDSVMTYQDVANLIAAEFPEKLMITGEDRFLGYSLMCGAQSALIGMGAGCTALQHRLLKAYFDGQMAEFQELSARVDRLAQVTFVAPMEGYIRRMLWVMVHEGVISAASAHDPWGPELQEGEFDRIGQALQAIGEIPAPKIQAKV